MNNTCDRRGPPDLPVIRRNPRVIPELFSNRVTSGVLPDVFGAAFLDALRHHALVDPNDC